MKYKKHMIILLAAIFLFAMATASATDSNDTAVAAEDRQLTDEIIQASENQENTMQASYNDEVNLSEDDSGKLAIGNDKKLGKTVTGHTFDDIQDAIESDCTIYLEPGTYNGNFQIYISQKSNIKIIGNSTILDGQGQTQIFFNKESSNITIQNIIFKNGKNSYAASTGGAIVMNMINDFSISNCTFINNTAEMEGGAIDCRSCVNGRISNCTFINNHAEMNGGAIDWFYSDGCRVNNCTFINNTAEWEGDAIYADFALNADYNWFGNTADNYNDPLPINRYVKCDYRLFLNATANPDTITGKDTSNVTFKLYQYHSDVTSDYDNVPFKNLDLTITATKGNVKGTAKLDEPIQFTPTGKGTASVTATLENVRQTVEINVLKGDFDLLQDLVNNESLSIINLERNYTYNEFDTITDGVRINRPITINGNGFTIDAKGKSRIFYVTAGSINITNVTLKNGKANSGSAIYFENAISNSSINATYINNTATRGGANYFLGSVSGSNVNGTYINNTAEYYGGANYFNKDVSGSNISGTYINNTAERGGGANNFDSVSTSNISGTYINNNATYGGANYFWGSVLGSNVSGTFINNTAEWDGGANYFDSVSTSNISGTYINNTAEQNGGANRFGSVLGSNVSGTFINNTAECDGGANYFWGSVLGSNVSGTYANNTAKNKGGANFLWHKVSGSNVGGIYINNTALNAVIYFEDYFYRGLDANITNAIFLNNNCTYEIYTITQGIVVKDSWFGNNASNFMNKPNVNDNVTVDNWLFLNATVNPSSLLILDSSNVTFKLYSTDGIKVSDFDNSKLPAVNLTLTATNGDVDKTTTLDNMVKYVATEHGKGSVTAKIENATYTIYSDNILRDVDLSVSAQNITYPENEILTLTYNNTAIGKVNITLKSKNYKKTIEGDINRTITIADLPAGEYDVTIEYLGDNVFSNATSSAYFTVEKITTEVIPDNETIELFVDDEYKITYTLSPDNALGNISFSSNDSNIASVDSESGKIMANAEGSATITVSFSGSENYTASNATVTVNVKKIPTQITVNSSDIDMKVNGETDVGAGLEPANAGNLTYKSSDEDIVIVENGKIKSLKEGNATITVSFAGDKKYAAAENKTITVNVRLNDVSISVNNATLVLFVDDTFTVVANTTPVGLNVTYIPDNSGVVSVDNDGVVTALKEGTASIVVKVGGDGVYAENSTTVGVTVNKIPTEIIVQNATVDMKVSDEVDSVVSLMPSGAGELDFTSSDVSVVTVDGIGTITAVGEGTANITVRFLGNDKYVAAESKNITVTVTKIGTSIDVDVDTINMKVGDEVTVNATLTPGEAGELDYTSSDVSVVTVNGIGEITAVGEGVANVTVRFIGNDKYAAAESKNITVTVSLNDVSVSVNNATLDLFVGDTFTVVANTTPVGLNVTYVPDNSGVVSVDENGIVTALKEGIASITVKVGGDGVYAENSATVTVTVNKIPTEIIVQNATVNMKVDDEFDPVVSLMPSNAGNLSFKSNNGSVVIVNAYGIITAVGEGEAIVTVAFSGNEKYAAESKNITVTVSLIDASVSVNNSTFDLLIDDTFTLVVTTNPAGLNVTYVPDNSGVVNVTSDGVVTALKEGTATILVKVGGDGVYAENSTTIAVTVNKQNATADVSMPDNITVGDNSTVDVTLPSGAGGKVTLKVDGEVVDEVNVTNGTASVELPGLSAGNHTVEIAYSGDSKYNPVNQTKEITVSKKDTTPEITIPSDIEVGDNSTVNVVLPEDATGNVTVMVDGEVADTVSVTDGTAEVTIPSMGAGNHTVEIAYSGGGKYNPVNQTKEITVSKKDTTPEITIPSDIEIGDNATVDVKLPDDAGGNVTLKVDGETVDTVPVENGTASVKLPELNAGNHTVEIDYSGDDKYNSASKTATISVNKDSTNITAADVTATYKVNKYLIINLTDSRGNPLANATVTVELNTAKNYTSDENGQIKVKVSSLVPKTYAAKITFKGDEKYAGSNTTAKVTVKKATSKITAKAKTFKTTTKTKKYTVMLKANGKALKNKWVYLKVNGKTYKAKTNSKGKATFKITQLNKAGKFKATVTFKGNDYYKKATKKATIKVKSVWKTVQKGSKNSAIVKKIQRALKNHGYYLEYNGRYLMVDGIFWDYTEMAVKEFQKDKTLKVTGKVDEKTAKKLGII